MTDPQARLSFWVLAAIFVTAAATNANDYSFLVPRQDVRVEVHKAVIDRTAPDTSRYHVLVPYLAEPAIRLLAPRMSYDLAFRRVYALYYLAALTMLFAVVFRYLSFWFSDVQALAGSLLVGSTIRIVLRQGEYLDLSSIPTSSVFSPWSLLDPIVIAIGLIAIVNERRSLLALLIGVGALNSAAVLLLPVVYLVTRPFTRKSAMEATGFAVIGLVVLGGLRYLLGEAPHLSEPSPLMTATINLALFLGPVWVLVVVGLKRAPGFVLHSAIAIPVYAIVMVLLVRNWDLLLMTPLYPLLLPLAMSALFRWRERAR